jgi:glycerol-3-phosphate dehydrogenase
VVIGTSDLPVDSADGSVCTEEEIDYFIELTSRIFPSIPVRREDIVYTFSGVRPLPPSKARSAGQVTRDHSLKSDRLGDLPLLSLVGGKWTTYRAFAEQASDRILGLLGKPRRATTRGLPIGGGRDCPSSPAAIEDFVLSLVKERGLSFARATTLFERYGTRARELALRIDPASGETALASLPSYSREELAFLIEAEEVFGLDDLLIRRTTIAWLGQASLALLEECSVLLAKALGWNEAERRREVERVATLLRQEHRARL